MTGPPASFFKSIVNHANKSVDGVIVDLKGASKDQVGAIKNFVSGLKDAQKNKINYVQ